MKKNYFLAWCCAAIFSAGTFNAGAQLSGLYTIDSGSPTAGTNFISFTDFATAVNTSGISGPVTVNVVANTGPYVEQVNFLQANGISSSNRIIVNGNNNLITYNSSNSAAPWTIRLEGADNMTFNNLNVEATGTYAYALLLFSGANSNNFNSCTFSVSISGSSTNQMPVVVSGSGTSYGTMANSGNNNQWQSCTTSGGYYGISFYGSSSSPYNSNNRVINCNILDWYSRGISHYYYQKDYVIRGNLISRPNRTNSTTTYGIYSYYNEGTRIENNRIQGLFDNMMTNSSTTYGMYVYYNTATSAKGNPNYIRNNIIADIEHNGSVYGLAAFYIDGYVEHNTISLDYAGSTSGTAYGLYVYSQAGKEMEVTNNIVSITKGGTSTKYGIYYSITGYVTTNYNDYYVNSAGGSNNIGYYGGTQTTLANLQTASGQDANSQTLNPNFTNIATNDYHPTNVALNNLGTPVSVLTDIDNNVRNTATPDMGALEFLTPLCAGTPSSNSVNAPTYSICPGEDVGLILSTLVADAGITYQWNVSTVSNVGPFTPISGANSFQYTAPSVTANTWYQVVMTCTAPGGGSISPVAMVMVSAPVSSTVPYYEGFENIGLPNRLPNCSWTASGIGTSNLTYTSSQTNNRMPNTGNNFASFSNSSTGASYFFTNPIQMNTGITYSAAVHWATEYFGYSNWTSLEILVGPNQSPTGLVQVANVSPAISGPYKVLGNTFTVPSSGMYYVAIKATSSSGSALYLSIDDISVTIPCDPASPNSPTVSMSSSSSTVCAGQALNLTAAGANTYSWSTGASGQTTVEYPTTTGNFIVYGTNTLTGCTGTATQLIYVNPSPNVFAVANQPVACSGSSVSMTAYGALAYAWSNGQNGPTSVVTPTANANYTVIGTNAFGCTGNYVVQLTVRPLPAINVLSSNAGEACKDDVFTLSASGAVTYQWASSVSNQLYAGSSISISSPATAIYTVTGTDANGCQGKAVITQAISDCTGINEYIGSNINAIYPNPTAGALTIQFKDNIAHQVDVIDASGRLLISKLIEGSSSNIELDNLDKGVYFIKISSEQKSSTHRIIKQ